MSWVVEEAGSEARKRLARRVPTHAWCWQGRGAWTTGGWLFGWGLPAWAQLL